MKNKQQLKCKHGKPIGKTCVDCGGLCLAGCHCKAGEDKNLDCPVHTRVCFECQFEDGEHSQECSKDWSQCYDCFDGDHCKKCRCCEQKCTCGEPHTKRIQHRYNGKPCYVIGSMADPNKQKSPQSEETSANVNSYLNKSIPSSSSLRQRLDKHNVVKNDVAYVCIKCGEVHGDGDARKSGYEEGLKDNQKKGEAFRKGYTTGRQEVIEETKKGMDKLEFPFEGPTEEDRAAHYGFKGCFDEVKKLLEKMK